MLEAGGARQVGDNNNIHSDDAGGRELSRVAAVKTNVGSRDITHCYESLNSWTA